MTPTKGRFSVSFTVSRAPRKGRPRGSDFSSLGEALHLMRKSDRQLPSLPGGVGRAGSAKAAPKKIMAQTHSRLCLRAACSRGPWGSRKPDFW